MSVRFVFAVGLSICSFSAGASAQSCLEQVAGESMARMIAEAGGAAKLRDMANAQVAEIDSWLAQLEASRGQGIREAEIEAMREQGVELRDVNTQIAAAAECYI